MMRADVQSLQHMHPLGLTDDWADKLANEPFFSPNAMATFEHYMQAGSLTPARVFKNVQTADLMPLT